MSPWAKRTFYGVLHDLVVREHGCYHGVYTDRSRLRLLVPATPSHTLEYAPCWWGLFCDGSAQWANYAPLRGFTARPITCLACLAQSAAWYTDPPK